MQITCQSKGGTDSEIDEILAGVGTIMAALANLGPYPAPSAIEFLCTLRNEFKVVDDTDTNVAQ